MRTKRALYNLITGIFPQAVVGVLGVIKVRVFLQTLGSDYNGLIQLFTQIFAYLSLTEAGIGSAIQFRLFKLLSDGQYNKVNQILSGASKYFKWLTRIVFIASIGLSFFVNVFINQSPFSDRHVQLLFLIFALTNTIPFLYYTERVLLASDQRNYITNVIFHSSTILKSVIELFLLTRGIGIINYLIISFIFNVLQWIIFKYVTSGIYAWYEISKMDINDEFKTDMKHLMPHKLIFVVVSNTDIIVISSFLGIFSASVYAIYNYVLNFLNQIITQISSAIFSVLGNYVHTESVERSKKLFDEYFFVVSCIANMLFIPLFFVFNQFVGVWAGEVYVLDRWTLLSFLLILHLTIILIPSTSFVNVKGYFKESKYSIIIELILNVSLSITLVNVFGINGVLIATLISKIPSALVYIPYILYKNYFETSLLDFYFRLAKTSLVSLTQFAAITLLVQVLHFDMSTIYMWFFSGFVIFVFNFIVLIALQGILFNKEFRSFASRWKAIAR